MAQLRVSGKIALVDDEFIHDVAEYNWHINSKGYVTRRVLKKDPDFGTGSRIKLHQFILYITGTKFPLPKGVEIDHIDRNKLNNKITNLKICSHKQNMNNANFPLSTISGERYIYWLKPNDKWRVNIMKQGKRKHVGLYETIEEAILARDKAMEWK